jgi:hypothetical protein
LERVEVRLDRLEGAFLQFSDALLTTLWAKGVLSETWMMALRGSPGRPSPPQAPSTTRRRLAGA